jgi:hypothetical protein
MMVKKAADDDGERSAEIKIPKHVSPRMKKWILEVLEGWEPFPEDVSVAILGAEAADRCEAARKVIAAKGATYLDRFGNPRTRPEVAIERDSRIAFLRCVRQLKDAAADDEPDEEPTRPYSNFRKTPEWVRHLRERVNGKTETPDE